MDARPTGCRSRRTDILISSRSWRGCKRPRMRTDARANQSRLSSGGQSQPPTPSPRSQSTSLHETGSRLWPHHRTRRATSGGATACSASCHCGVTSMLRCASQVCRANALAVCISVASADHRVRCSQVVWAVCVVGWAVWAGTLFWFAPGLLPCPCPGEEHRYSWVSNREVRLVCAATHKCDYSYWTPHALHEQASLASATRARPLPPAPPIDTKSRLPPRPPPRPPPLHIRCPPIPNQDSRLASTSPTPELDQHLRECSHRPLFVLQLCRGALAVCQPGAPHLQPPLFCAWPRFLRSTDRRDLVLHSRVPQERDRLLHGRILTLSPRDAGELVAPYGLCAERDGVVVGCRWGGVSVGGMSVGVCRWGGMLGWHVCGVGYNGAGCWWGGMLVGWGVDGVGPVLEPGLSPPLLLPLTLTLTWSSPQP